MQTLSLDAAPRETQKKLDILHASTKLGSFCASTTKPVIASKDMKYIVDSEALSDVSFFMSSDEGDDEN